MKKEIESKKNVLVIFGGKSVEHDVSIITGIQTINNLNKQKYNIFPIYINKDGLFLYSSDFSSIKPFVENKITTKNSFLVNFSIDGFLCIKKGKKYKKFKEVDFAYLATHGGYGENGSLQGFLDMCNIPYSSSGTLGSSVGMNKVITKNVLDFLGIKNTKYKILSNNELKLGQQYINKKVEELKYPLIVKPCALGSSIGVNFVKNKQALKNAISFAFLFDNFVLVEEAVENLREVNIAVMGNSIKCECSDIEEVFKTNDLLSFENKYLENNSSKGMESTKRVLPANLTTDIEDIIKDYARKLFKAINCKGIVRIDFLIDSKTNEVFLNEINTIPGSMANYLWKTKKYSFSELLDKLLAYSLEEKKESNNKIKNFSSNILEKFNNNSFKLSK